MSSEPGEYLLSGTFNLVFAALTIPVVIIGIKTTNMRIHNVMATVFLAFQWFIGFGNIENLAT